MATSSHEPNHPMKMANVSQSVNSNSLNSEFKVFDGLSAAEVDTILATTTRVPVASGQAICRQGEAGTSMFFLVAGRAEVSVEKTDEPDPTIINKLGPGSHFGAMSLLIGSPRSATITAIMDSEVLQLQRDDFEQLVETIPGFAANLSRTLGGWLQGQLTGHKESKAIRVIGIVTENGADAMLGPAVASTLARNEASILALTSGVEKWNVLDPISEVHPVAIEDKTGEILSVSALATQVEQHTYTIIDLDQQFASSQQLLQCEKIWWVIDRDVASQPQLDRIKNCIAEIPELAKRIQIVESHAQSHRLPGVLNVDFELAHEPMRIQRKSQRCGQPKPSNQTGRTSPIDQMFDFSAAARRRAGWTDRDSNRPPESLFGFRIQDVARLQHQLQGISLGLVLGGGGARGLAHIGALEVFESHGLFFDQIAGTSAGSIVGCGYAAGMNPAEILNLINTEMTPPKWIQKLPHGKRLHLFFDFRRGRIETKLRKHLFDYDFQQLLIPMNTVAVDLISGEQVISSSGDVASSIRASANHPVFGAPIIRDGRALVDGAVLNNVPATVLRERNADFILSIDVGSKLDPEFVKTKSGRNGQSSPRVGYVSTLMRVLEVIQRGHSRTHISHSDYVIAPDTSQFPFEDFTNANELALVGKEAAEKAIPEFLSSLEPWLTMPHPAIQQQSSWVEVQRSDAA